MSEPERRSIRDVMEEMALTRHDPTQIAEIVARLMEPLAADARELDWWRTNFTCRFMHNNLPRPGDALYGTRFKLMHEVAPGDWQEWVARPERRDT